MPSFSTPARRPHASPCDPAYHIFCPECGGWIDGARAVAPVAGFPGNLAVTCDRCHSEAPGRFDTEMILTLGPYSGRTVASLSSPAELAVLEHLLTEQIGHSLRLAILWRLGWLDPTRQQRAPGPDVEGFRRAHEREQERAQARTEREERYQAGQQQRAREQDDWMARLRAEAEKNRRQREEQRQQAPKMPQGDDTAEWLRTLELTPPITREGVRLAYHRLSKARHPDRGGDVEQMQLLNLAKAQAGEWLSGSGKVKI